MSRRSHVMVIVLLATTAVSISGCGFLMRMAGEAASAVITQKTADLEPVSAMLSYTTNLYPPDAKTVETEIVGDAWQAGSNSVGINFLKRQGIGMWEIDGTVTARKGPKDAPVPLQYWGKGAYALALPAGDRAPRTIEIVTSTGQRASFVVKPAAPITIKAVNGKPNGASVDLGKDLVIDLDNPGSGKLKVAMIASALGIRTMMDLAVVKAAKRLVIPAAAYRHMGVTASMGGVTGVDAGSNYVMVERYEAGSIANKGQMGAAFSLGKSWGYSPVTVTGNVKNAAPFAGSGKLKRSNGDLAWAVSKSGAFYAPPLPRMKKVVIGNLLLQANLFKQNTSTSTSYGINTVTTTTTTITLAFPKVAPAAWDRVLDDTVAGLVGSLRTQSPGLAQLPSERLMASNLYKTMEIAPEQVNDQLVEKTYKNMRHVFPVSLSGVLSSVSSTFALDRPVVRLLNEIGADAVLTGTLNMQIGTKQGTEKLALLPSLTWALTGTANGYNVGPLVYAAGTVSSQDGVTFSKEELENVSAMRRVTRLDDLLAGMRESLKALRTYEKQEGYDAIWALQ